MQKLLGCVALCLLISTHAQSQNWGLPWALKPTLTDCDRFTYGLGNGQLIVAQQGKLFGLKDKNGAPILGYEFDFIQVAENGVVKARKNGQAQWLTYRGEPFDADIEQVIGLQDGRFLVQKGGKFGLLDASRKLVKPIEYELQEEGEDMFLVRGSERVALGPSLTADKKTPPATNDLQSTPNWPGVNLYVDSKTGRVGIQNKKNKPVTPAIYTLGRGYEFGHATATKDGFKWGVLRSDGHEMTEFKFDDIFGLNPELVSAVRMGDDFNLLDATTDKLILPARAYSKVEPLPGQSPALFAVTKNEQKGVVDKQGKVVLAPEFAQVTRQGDFILVANGVPPRGKKTLPLQGAYALNGKAVVAVDSVQIHVFPNQTLIVQHARRGIQHLNTKGDVLASFPRAALTAQSWLMVEENGNKKFYHYTSTPDHPVWVDNVQTVDNQPIQIVQKGALFGLMHENGQVLVPTEAESLRVLGAYVYVKYEGKWGVLKNTFATK